MELTAEQKLGITIQLRKRNKRIWTDQVIMQVHTLIQNYLSGAVNKSDWFIPNLMTVEDVLFQINLNKFLNNEINCIRTKPKSPP